MTTMHCEICGVTRLWKTSLQAEGDRQGHARWHEMVEIKEES